MGLGCIVDHPIFITPHAEPEDIGVSGSGFRVEGLGFEASEAVPYMLRV